MSGYMSERTKREQAEKSKEWREDMRESYEEYLASLTYCELSMLINHSSYDLPTRRG